MMHKNTYLKILSGFLAAGVLMAPLGAQKKPGEVKAPSPKTTTQYPADISKSRVVNRLRYMVGSIAVTELDIQSMRDDLTLIKAARRRRRGKPRRISRAAAVQELITRAIVRLEASKESLSISNARIENEIQTMKENKSISSDAEFRKVMEKESGLPFKLWLRELPYQLLRRHIIQIRVRTPRPTEAEMRKFYNKNKKRVGFEVSYRMLVFRPRGISQERSYSRLARQAREKIAAKPSRFYRISRSYPQGRYRSYGYRSLQEVYIGNKRLAGLLFNLPSGAVGPLFVDKGRYMIVQLRGRRATPFVKVRRVILQRLAIDKQQQAFLNWVEKRKKEIAVVEIP